MAVTTTAVPGTTRPSRTWTTTAGTTTTTTASTGPRRWCRFIRATATRGTGTARVTRGRGSASPSGPAASTRPRATAATTAAATVAGGNRKNVERTPVRRDRRSRFAGVKVANYH